MTLPVGAIVQDLRGAYFIIEAGSKRQFPDKTTLSALSLGMNGRVPTVSDAVLNAFPAAAPFPSLMSFIAAHPGRENEVQRAVNALLATAGVKGVPERLAFIVGASANLYGLAMEEPHEEWRSARVIRASFLDPQTKDIGDKEEGVKEVGDKEQGQKESGEKEADEKEAGEKEQGEKEQGEKDFGKEQGEKEEGGKESKDVGDKDASDKEQGDKDQNKEFGDKEEGQKEDGEKEAGDKDVGDKDEGDKEFFDKDFEKDNSAKDVGDKEEGEKDAGDEEGTPTDPKDDDIPKFKDGLIDPETEEAKFESSKEPKPDSPEQAPAKKDWDKYSA